MTAAASDAHAGIRWPASTQAGRARAAAIDELDVLPGPDGWVEYRSSGRLLIIGPADDALPLAEALKDELTCTLLATRPPAEPPEAAPPVRYLDGRPHDLTGHLGAFTLNVEVDRGRVLEAGAAFGIESGTFDLVLDLDGSGNLRMDEPPPGYYLAPDADRRQEALEELPQMIGEFQKPRYFAYDADICAHGASGMTGCSNCLLACATEAIVSIGDKVEVDPYLCQGCGSCATVCPTGAMQYQAPPVGDVLDGARRMLRAFRERAGDEAAPEILLYNVDSAHAELVEAAPALPEHLLPLPVEDVGSVGMDAWLSMLAFGAARVWMLPGPLPAPSKVEASRGMIRVVSRVLEGLGDPDHAERVIWLRHAGDVDESGAVRPLVREPAGFAALGNKREVIRRALKVLHAQAEAPREVTPLPAGAPFGAIRVDGDACTLCMGCVSVCPASAVQGGGDQPRLELREDHCVQCGLCEQACPENAIELQPRMNFAAHLEPDTTLLNEAAMHRCPDCGKAFATERMIERMLERLAGHWMYQDEDARNRLLLCEDCRIKRMWDDEGTLDVHRDKRP